MSLISGIAQIALSVRDLARANVFYRDALGLQHLFDAPGMSFFDVGGTRLMLTAQGGEPGARTTLVYFKVADVVAVHAELAARSVPFEKAPHVIGRSCGSVARLVQRSGREPTRSHERQAIVTHARRAASSPFTLRLSLAVALTLGGCALAPAQRQYIARVEALALLQTLNADLLSHDSATLTLERWCADHHLADPAHIVAHRARDGDKPMPDELRTQLAVDANEPIRYRHVQLVCGEHVLSAADNWYVPSRLTTEMNWQLDNTDEPFGKVVKPLRFRRHTISAELLWQPLPQGWEMPAAKFDSISLRIPHDVLRHQAILYTSAQVPFSAVVETYTSENFAFRR